MTRAALILAGFLAGAVCARHFADPPPLVVTFELKPPTPISLAATSEHIQTAALAWSLLRDEIVPRPILVTDGSSCTCIARTDDHTWIEVRP